MIVTNAAAADAAAALVVTNAADADADADAALIVTNAAAAAALADARGARTEDEFKTFMISPQMKLINPSLKEGRILFDSLAKTDVKPEDRFKGHSSEIEPFRKALKSISNKLNCKDVLTFSFNGKEHDLASAPERTTVHELFEHNKENTWSFHGSNPVQNPLDGSWSAVPLHDKAKVNEDDKLKLRKTIDIRSRNQIILKIIMDSTDPDFLSTLLSKKANKKLLQWKNLDLDGNTIIDGSMLLLLIAKQICPSTI